MFRISGTYNKQEKSLFCCCTESIKMHQSRQTLHNNTAPPLPTLLLYLYSFIFSVPISQCKMSSCHGFIPFRQRGNRNANSALQLITHPDGLAACMCPPGPLTFNSGSGFSTPFLQLKQSGHIHLNSGSSEFVKLMGIIRLIRFCIYCF